MLLRARQFVRHAPAFIHHVVPAVIRPLHALWNQVIGFLFLVLAVIAAPKAWRSVHEFSGDGRSFVNLFLAGIFFVAMSAFAIQSFWKAWRIGKSPR